MIDICKKCESKSFIVNKKYFLCFDCNHRRLHHGKSQLEITIEKNKNKQIKKRKSYPPTKKALKEREIKAQLKLLKQKIHTDNQENNTYYCQGCLVNGYNVYLDCSHLIAVGKNKSLELLYENIQLMCRNCHVIWESQNKDTLKLKCFQSNLEFIKNHDNVKYQKLLIMIDENK